MKMSQKAFQASLDHSHCFIRAEDPGQFPAQLRMATEFAAQQNSVALFFFAEGFGGAVAVAVAAKKPPPNFSGSGSFSWRIILSENGYTPFEMMRQPLVSN